MKDVFEIERRYLIRYPNLQMLDSVGEKTEIIQTYLLPDDVWSTNRVRKRGRDGEYVYTHTRKRRISSITRIEEERVISESEYLSLLALKDPERNEICKRRYCCEYKEKMFEIDVFSFWDDRAILEVELCSENEYFELPSYIEVIREISTDGQYTNASLAKLVPFEII